MLQWSLHPLRFPRYRGTETLGIVQASLTLLSLNRIFQLTLNFKLSTINSIKACPLIRVNRQ